MNRIKVAIILPYFAPGGAEKMVSQLAARLDSGAFDTKVFCIYGEPLGNHLEQAVEERGVPIRFIGKKRGFSLSAVMRMFQELDKFNPDVIHTHQYACVYAALWPLLRKKPFLHTFHTMPQVENRRMVRRLLTKFLVGRNRMRPVAISKENQRLVADYYHLSPDAVPLVYNPVDTARIAAGKKVEDGQFRFITAGRFSREKNQQMMLRAFAAFLEKGYDAILVMLGKGEEEENLKTLAAELGIRDRIDFAGFVVNVEDYLINADVFLLSSDYEALPLALLEAMAVGLPIVATDVGGVCDVVTDNGILVPVGDASAMVGAMEKMYLDADVRLEMSAASAKNVQAYDVSNMVAGYCALYSQYAARQR